MDMSIQLQEFVMGIFRVRATLLWLSALAFVVGSTAVPASTQARGRNKNECRASGPPGQLESLGAFEATAPLLYDDQHWLVQIDQREKPKKIRLLSSEGRSMELPKPPPFEPTHWVGRGRSIYAVGTARSLEKGKVNVVIVRWAMDGRRPRLIRLWSQDGVAQGPTAAMVGSTLAIGWAAKTKQSRYRWTVGLVNLERLHIGDPKPLGKPTHEVAGHLVASGKTLVSLWSQGGKVRTARFQEEGREGPKFEQIPWHGKPTIAAVEQCGDNLFALDTKPGGVAHLLLLRPEGARKVTSFSSVLDTREMALTCTGNAAVLGHRVFNDKVGSIVFWISTVDAEGKTRARRLKDVKGKPDKITNPTLIGSGQALSAWWQQKNGRRTDLYTRPVGCK